MRAVLQCICLLTAAVLVLGLSALKRPRGQKEPAVSGTEYGEPIQGIRGREFEMFRLGLEDFLEVEDAEEGQGGQPPQISHA